jgi:hypothetical protein
VLKKDRRTEKMGFEHEHTTGCLPVDYDSYAVEPKGDQGEQWRVEDQAFLSLQVTKLALK